MSTTSQFSIWPSISAAMEASCRRIPTRISFGTRLRPSHTPRPNRSAVASPNRWWSWECSLRTASPCSCPTPSSMSSPCWPVRGWARCRWLNHEYQAMPSAGPRYGRGHRAHRRYLAGSLSEQALTFATTSPTIIVSDVDGVAAADAEGRGFEALCANEVSASWSPSSLRDPLVLIMTSGTTGAAKAVEISPGSPFTSPPRWCGIRSTCPATFSSAHTRSFMETPRCSPSCPGLSPAALWQ